MIIANLVGQTLSLQYDGVISDSVRFLTVHFTFDSSWDDTAKTAIFKNGSNTYGIALLDGNGMYLGSNICLVPQEVIKSPSFTVSVYGVKNQTTITSSEGTVYVEESGMADDYPADPTQSLWDQMLGIANNTLSIAQSVRNDADLGRFDGEDGEDGVDGQDGEKGDKGDKGDTGEKGDKGDTGSTGNGISSIVKTSTSANVDTYTITYTNGNTTTYTVTNGISVTGAVIDANGHLIISLSNGSEIDVNGNIETVNNKVTSLSLSSTDLQYPSAKSVYTELATKAKQISLDITNKKIKNIASLLEGHEFDFEDGTTPCYSQPVPTGAQPYAELSVIGGKSEVVSGEIVSGKCDKIVSIGKNLFNVFNCRGSDRCGLNSNGTLTVHNTTTYTSSTSNTKLKEFCPTLKVGDTVYFSATTTGTASYIYLEQATTGWNFGTSRTITKDMLNSTILFYSGGNLESPKTATISNIQIIYGTSASTYEPYVEHTYQIPTAIQNIAGYGWSAESVYNYVDFNGKKFHKRVARVDLGTLTWVDETARQSGQYMCLFTSSGGKYKGGLLCDKGYTNEPNATNNNLSDKSMTMHNSQSTLLLRIRDTDYPTYETFISAMNGVYLYFELLEEVITDISSYLTDDNFIETEQGGTITFQQQNNTQFALPNKVTYMVRNIEALGGE